MRICRPAFSSRKKKSEEEILVYRPQMASKSVDNKHMNLCYPIFSDGSEKAPQAEARGRRIKVLFEKEKYTTTMCIGK